MERTIKTQKSKIKNPSAFTLIELLVVVGIIGVLVAILIPVIGKVRAQSYVADTKNLLNQLVSAIERYHNDFHAYPGPLMNDQIRAASGLTAVATAGYDTANMYADKITGTENLVLGLLGGLRIQGNNIVYDPAIVGRGPVNLNVANPKRYEPYAELKSTSMHTSSAGLNTGAYTDGYFEADDSIIPEFVDRFPESMPLLYARARVGAGMDHNASLSAVNNGIVNDEGQKDQKQQYDLDQIIGYTGIFTGTRPGPLTLVQKSSKTDIPRTGHSIGTGKSPTPYYGGPAPANPPVTNFYHGLNSVFTDATTQQGQATYMYPYDAYAYLQSPANMTTARSKDTFILIAAGADRVYGTEDDIASFGDVQP